MKQRTVAIVQARMGSSRFPGKVLALLDQKPVIAWVIDRIRKAERLDEVVVATSESPADDPLAGWCQAAAVSVFRGSEQDVLERYVACARYFAADRVVRITADCPLLDPAIVDNLVRRCQSDPQISYVTNCEPSTFPEGMSAECLPMRVLELAHQEARTPFDREHVTPFIRFQPKRFVHSVLRADPSLADLRLTVDYPDDLSALETLVGLLKPRHEPSRATLGEIVTTLRANPELVHRLASHQRDLWRQELPEHARRRIA